MFIVELQDQPHRENVQFICTNATEVQRVFACEYNALIADEHKREFSIARPQWRSLICEPNISHLFSAAGIVYSVSPYKPGKRASITPAEIALSTHYGIEAYETVLDRFKLRMSQ
jgi:hypothetical protein